MGRMFDTLRRRDGAHASAGEATAPAPTAPTPRLPDRETNAGEEPLSGVGIPFVEVGAGQAEAPTGAAESRRSEAAAQADLSQPKIEAAGFQSERPAIVQDASPAAELVVWSQPKDPKAEQYRQVCTALLNRREETRFASLLLAPVDAVACAAAAANLALAFAEGGQRKVLLIDAAARTPTLANLFRSAAAPGWAELLLGLAPAQAIQETGYEALHFVAAGNRLAGANAIVCGQRLRALMRHWVKHYDLVLLQSASADDVTAVVALALACDATCFLKLESSSTAEQVCARALQREGVRVLGSIVAGK